jgi:hypothetical protein
VTVAIGVLSIALGLGTAILAFGWRVPVVALISLVLVGGLIAAAARRANWARWALASLIVVSTILTRSLVLYQLTFHVLIPLATVAQLALEAMGLYLLFRPIAGEWYRAGTGGN